MRRLLRAVLPPVFAGVAILLFTFLACGRIQQTAHTFCPYSTVCFGAFSHFTNLGSLFFPAATVFGAVVILSALLWGRAFCGFVCPFGTLQEVLFHLRKRPPQEIVKPGLHQWFHALRFSILIATGLFAASGLLIVYLRFCPVFAIAHPGGIALAGVLTLAVIVFGGFLVERLFCRYLCPFGALLSVFAWLGGRLHIRIGKVRRGFTQSLKCRNCPNYCPMGIPLSDLEVISSPDCIGCGRCIRRCGPNNPERLCIYGQLVFTPKKKDMPIS
jgi:polyferredoxin